MSSAYQPNLPRQSIKVLLPDSAASASQQIPEKQEPVMGLGT